MRFRNSFFLKIATRQENCATTSWEQLGSFGVRLDHPIIGSSSATSSTGSSSIYRNASYIDMALGQYPSVPPKRLQQILTASHYCTITSLQQQQQAIFDAGGSGGIGSGTNRNLLQFQQQQQADSLDGNNNAIVDFSTTNALQLPPILFASSSSLMPHNTSETTTTANDTSARGSSGISFGENQVRTFETDASERKNESRLTVCAGYSSISWLFAPDSFV